MRSNHSPSPDVTVPDGFRFIKVLGTGSMGVVVEALHILLQRTVCVKLLRRELTDDPNVVERFRVEAQALAALGGGNHPNLVHVSDFGVTADGTWYLVMERLRGRTLKEEIEASGAVPWREAAELIVQLLTGLDVAHRHGVVHRDIKPANLFLVDRPIPRAPRVLKILDFGIAKILKGGEDTWVTPPSIETEPGIAIGTPRYLSPEQTFANPVDHRADLYATGLILYELLAGRSPFSHRKAIQDIYRAQAYEIPEAPSVWVADGIAPELDRLVLKLLEKAPEDRFASASLARDALRQLLDAPPPKTVVTSPILFPRPTVRLKAAEAGTEVMDVEPRKADPQPQSPSPGFRAAPSTELMQVDEDEPRGVEALDAADTKKLPAAEIARIQGNTSSDPDPPRAQLAAHASRPAREWMAFALVLISSALVFSVVAWLLLRRSP